MKEIIGVIPARYQSSRLPGKPLVDICGKPMIWWVYQQAKKVPQLGKIYVATDDERIINACSELNIPAVMTSPDNSTHLNRISEFSQKIDADLYTVICGDEPLIKSEVISAIIPDEKWMEGRKYIARALMREFKDPAEVVDPGNIKIVANTEGECIYLSRSPIPFPYKTVMFKYRKIVGIECYNKAALDFFVSTSPGQYEKIEDITLLRFIENKMDVHFTLVESDALSVDTEKDLEKVRDIIGKSFGSKGQNLL